MSSTALAASPARPSCESDPLLGTRVRLCPYLRGCYQRDALYRVWQVLEQSQAGPILFWGNQEANAIHSDLVAFVRYFQEEDRRHLVILTTPDRAQIIGFLWFEDIIEGFRCFGNIFMRRKYWGEASHEAVRLGVRYAFTLWKLESIWAVTPWSAAEMLCRRAGFQFAGHLPRFAKVRDTIRDVTILKIEREAWNGLNLP